MSLSRKLKKQWGDLLLGDFTPHSMALGLAIGTFVALLPTFGFSALLALVVIFIFPHINRPAIFVALMIWNPLVQIPLYAMSFQLGAIMFQDAVVVAYNFTILDQLYSFTRRFLVAHMVITVGVTLITYFVSKIYISRQLFRGVK